MPFVKNASGKWITADEVPSGSVVHGECYCKKIKFEAARDSSTKIVHCHCQSCREWTGCAFFSAILTSPVKITAGTPKAFQRQGGDVRWFCPDCGTHLYRTGGKKTTIAAGILKENHTLETGVHVQMADKVTWCNVVGEGKPMFDEWPVVVSAPTDFC